MSYELFYFGTLFLHVLILIIFLMWLACVGTGGGDPPSTV